MHINADTQHFIALHRNHDVKQLALAAHNAPNIDLPFALNQIAGWQKATKKLPAWADNPNIVYPPHLAMEQCSSQATAEYKADVARMFVNAIPQCRTNGMGKDKTDGEKQAHNKCECTSLVDLTGGFGVDFAFMAAHFSPAIYVERQPLLCQLVQHNLNALHLGHAKVVCADAESHLERMEKVLCIYLDPARRDKNGAKTVLIEHCSPDVLLLLPKLLAKSCLLMVKLSPMLHWQQAIKQMHERGAWVRQMHIVAVKNECKELLFLVIDVPKGVVNPSLCATPNRTHLDALAESSCLEHGAAKALTTEIICYNDGDRFEYALDEADTTTQSILQTPPQVGMFLFEPNAAIMKAGCFGMLCARFGVQAIAHNSHLFVANDDIPNFPGRRFRLVAATSFNKHDLKNALKDISQANIATRNFPLNADALRKKLKLKDGGPHFLFATTDEQGRHWMLKGERVKG